MQGLPGTHTVLNGEIDGTFPAHHPDPTIAKNLEQLIAEVKDPSPMLTIVQSETAVTITDAHGAARMFHTNGKEEIQQLDAGPMATTSKWDGGKLVIEYRVEKKDGGAVISAKLLEKAICDLGIDPEKRNPAIS